MRNRQNEKASKTKGPLRKFTPNDMKMAWSPEDIDISKGRIGGNNLRIWSILRKFVHSMGIWQICRTFYLTLAFLLG